MSVAVGIIQLPYQRQNSTSAFSRRSEATTGARPTCALQQSLRGGGKSAVFQDSRKASYVGLGNMRYGSKKAGRGEKLLPRAASASVPAPETPPEKTSQEDGLTKQHWSAFFGCVLVNFCLGSFYSWSCYVAPLEASLGVGRALLSSVFSGALIMFTATMCLAIPEVMATRLPATVTLTAVLMAVAGLWTCALAVATSQVALLFVGYSLGFGGACGLANGTAGSIATTMKACQGIATGVIASAWAVGASAFAPVIEWLIREVGLQNALLAQGAILFALAAIPGTWLVRGGGATAPLAVKPAAGAGAAEGGAAPAPALPIGLLRGIFGFGAFAGLTAISHAAPLLLSVGGTAAIAASGVALVNSLSAAGRVGGGWVADHLPPMKVLVGVPLLAIPGLLFAATSPSVVSAQMALFGAGLSYGALCINFPVYISRAVGTANFARVYGQVFLAWGAAGLSAPWVAGYVFEGTKSYAATLLLATCACLLSSLCAYAVLRRDANKRLDS